MGKVAMMTGKLVEMTTNYETNALNRTLREKAFMLDEEFRPMMHTGNPTAERIHMLRLPLTADVVIPLFAQIANDGSLVKKKRAREYNLTVELDNSNTPGKNLITVSPQTYQNYKSALKWWHEYDNSDIGKVLTIYHDSIY